VSYFFKVLEMSIWSNSVSTFRIKSVHVLRSVTWKSTFPIRIYVTALIRSKRRFLHV